MKKIILMVLLLLIAGTGYWYFFLNKKTDSELIEEQLHKFASICSKKGEESSLSMAAANAGISKFIASKCSVSIDQMMMNGSYTPMEFAGSMSRSRALFNSLEGTVGDVEVTLDPNEKSRAMVEYSVRVKGSMKKGREFDEGRDLQSEMRKEDDIWKFASFEIREVLEK